MGEIGAGKNDSPNIKNMGKGADSDKLAEVVRDQQEERRKSPTKEPMKISAETGSQDPKAKQVLEGFSVSEPDTGQSHVQGIGILKALIVDSAQKGAIAKLQKAEKSDPSSFRLTGETFTGAVKEAVSESVASEMGNVLKPGPNVESSKVIPPNPATDGSAPTLPEVKDNRKPPATREGIRAELDKLDRQAHKGHRSEEERARDDLYRERLLKDMADKQ